MGCGSSAAKSGAAVMPTKGSGVEQEPGPKVNNTQTETKHIGQVNDTGLVQNNGTEHDPTESHTESATGKSSLKDNKESDQTSAPHRPTQVEKPTSKHGLPPVEDWSTADRVALECPLTIRRTVTHLTEYFKESGLTGRFLSRAIFRWMTCHLVWRAGGSQEPLSVLRKGGGEDQGFAALFTAMCAECNLSAESVEGHVKDADYTPGSLPASTGHYWNILHLAERSYVVDCCRGAGLVRGGVFEPLYSDYYWLPPPSDIIYTHYPLLSEHQGCHKLYSLEEWVMLPNTTQLYFKFGCGMPDNLQGVFQATESLLQVNFTIPSYITCNSEILRLNPKQKLPQSYSYTSQDEDKVTVHTGYPYPGTYLLRLMGGERETDGAMKEIVEVAVNVETGRGTDPLYPAIVDHSKAFVLVGPLMGELVRDMSAYFHCKVKGASQVSVLVGEDICPLKKISDNTEALIEAAKRLAALTRTTEAVPPDDTAPAESEPAETAPAETEPAESAPAETAPAESAPAETAPAESAPAESAPAESAPAESAPAETAPAETAPAETAPAETAPAETAPAETAPADSLSSAVIRVTPATPISIPETDVTSVWAGEALIRGREVYLAAFYSPCTEYTKLVRFHTKLI